MYAGASAIPSILFHSILSACSQINGIDHSPFSVTDTTTGMSKNGAINGITTIQPTQTSAIMRRVKANCLSFNPYSRAEDTAFCCCAIAAIIMRCCSAFAFTICPISVVMKPISEPPSNVIISWIRIYFFFGNGYAHYKPSFVYTVLAGAAHRPIRLPNPTIAC